MVKGSSSNSRTRSFQPSRRENIILDQILKLVVDVNMVCVDPIDLIIRKKRDVD